MIYNSIIVSTEIMRRGIAIINKTDYIYSMSTMINDKTKFEKTPIKTSTLKMNDKINNLLRKLNYLKLISEDAYTKHCMHLVTLLEYYIACPKFIRKTSGSNFSTALCL